MSSDFPIDDPFSEEPPGIERLEPAQQELLRRLANEGPVTLKALLDQVSLQAALTGVSALDREQIALALLVSIIVEKRRTLSADEFVSWFRGGSPSI
jgi:hypothetical protein